MFQVAPEQLSAWIAQFSQEGQSPLLLDVREDWELKTASITPPEGLAFLHCPMQRVPGLLGQLDTQRPIVVMCHHGVRSMHVARFMEAQGFEHIANLTGGIHDWAQRLDPRVAVY